MAIIPTSALRRYDGITQNKRKRPGSRKVMLSASSSAGAFHGMAGPRNQLSVLMSGAGIARVPRKRK